MKKTKLLLGLLGLGLLTSCSSVGMLSGDSTQVNPSDSNGQSESKLQVTAASKTYASNIASSIASLKAIGGIGAIKGYAQNNKVTEEMVNEITSYLPTIEVLLAEDNLLNITNIEMSDREGYDSMMSVRFTDLNGTINAYTFYYTEVVEGGETEKPSEDGEVVPPSSGEVVVPPTSGDNEGESSSEVPSTSNDILISEPQKPSSTIDAESGSTKSSRKSHGFDFDDVDGYFKEDFDFGYGKDFKDDVYEHIFNNGHHFEDFEGFKEHYEHLNSQTTKLKGLVVMGEDEYEVSGKKKVKDDETEVSFQLTYAEGTSLRIEQSIEDNEQEFSYTMFENYRKVSSYSLELEKDDVKTEVSVTSKAIGSNKFDATFEIYKLNEETLIKAEVKIAHYGNVDLEFYKVVDSETGTISYKLIGTI